MSEHCLKFIYDREDKIKSLESERDIWKSKAEYWKHEADLRSQKAEKLAEALMEIEHHSENCRISTGDICWTDCPVRIAKEALAEYEKGI